MRNSLLDLSSILYNKGLYQAQNRNLSGAILTLTESLRIDKKNSYARNLLGLIYLEIGLVGDAVKHWVISDNYQKKDNRAKFYLEDIHKNTSGYERLDEAVRAYNMALEYISNTDDDLAIIQLKRAIELSPNFVSALNLLAFLYLLKRNSELALAFIDRVILIDEGNETAVRYCKVITGVKMKASAGGQPIGKAKDDLSAAPSSEPPFVEARTAIKGNEKKTRLFNDIVFLSIGVVIAILVMYALIVPAIVQNEAQRAGELADELVALNESYQTTRAEMSDQIYELEGLIENLETIIASQSEQISHFGNIQSVTSAGWLLDAGNLVGAAEIIYNTSLDGVPADVLEKAEEIIEATYNYTASRFYNDGISAFNAGNYLDARASLQSALRFSRALGADLANIYFYLGSSEVALGNTEAAISHFNAVLENYPDSNAASRAHAALEAVN